MRKYSMVVWVDSCPSTLEIVEIAVPFLSILLAREWRSE